MAGIYTKIRWGRAVGAYLGKGRIVLTEVASTPVGTVVLSEHCQEIKQDDPGTALKEWLETHLTLRQRRLVPVCVGLAPEHAFFTTCFLDGEQKDAISPLELLEACGVSCAWDKEDTAADYVEAKLSGNHVYSISATKRKIAEQVLSALEEIGIRKSRLEPAPWSLLKAADRQGKPPKKWKQAIRVLLDESNGMAMLVVDGRPVLWRRFAIGEKDPALSIASAIRTLQVHASQKLDVGNLCGVFIQGTIAEGLLKRVEDETGMPVMSAAGDGPTEKQYSLALAISMKKDEAPSLDLLKLLRPPPNIRDIFPWKLAALILFLGGCMAFMLWNKSTELLGQYKIARRQNASYKWARSQKTNAINKDCKVLGKEVNAVRKFVSTRIIWSNYLRDIPTRLPPDACLSNIWASCELAQMAKKKHKRRVNKSLTIRGMARFVERGGTPREIDAFLESLRSVELLKRDFPLVQLAEIKWRKEGTSEVALFTILARPRKKGKKSK